MKVIFYTYKKETNHVKIKVENKYFETNKVDLSDFYKFVDVNIKGELAEKLVFMATLFFYCQKKYQTLKA